MVNDNSQSPTPERQVSGGEDLVEIDLREMVAILLSRWPLILGLMIGAVIIAWVFSSMVDPVYQSSAELIVDQDQASVGQDLFYPTLNRSDNIANRLQIIQSPLVLNKAVEQLVAGGEKKSIQGLSRQMQVSNISDTDIIHITVTGPSPGAARDGAEAVAEAYQNYRQERAKEQSVRILSFLEEQVKRSEKEVEQAEQAVRDYQQKVGIISLDNEASKLNDQLTDLEKQRTTADISLQQKQLRLQESNKELDRLERNLPENAVIVTHDVITELQGQLADLEAERVDYLNRGLSASAPEVKSLDKRIGNLQESIRHYSAQMASESSVTGDGVPYYRQLLTEKISLKGEIAGLQSQIQLVEKKIDGFEQQLSRLSDKGYELARLQRDVSITQDTYSMLSTELEKSRIAVEREMGDVRIISPASLPGSPIKPRVELNLAIAGFLGLFLGVGLVFFMEYLDNSVKEPGQLEELGLGMLGAISYKSSDPEDRGEFGHFITSESDPLAMAYIRVESNLRFATFDEPARILQVTSSLPGEGKSTTLLNLAFVLAHSGEKVLAIDTDLRKPILHRALGLQRQPGLTALVAGQIEAKDVIRHIEADEGVSFDVITSGSRPPSIVNLLRSDQLKLIIKELRKEYDWILLDSPPVQVASDSMEISKLVDGVLMIINSGETPMPVLRDTVEQLHRANANMLGAVMNMSDQHKNRYGYYRYAYGYKYNYGYGYGYGYDYRYEDDDQE